MNIKPKTRLRLTPADTNSAGEDMCDGCFFDRAGKVADVVCRERTNVCVQDFDGRLMIFTEVRPHGD